MREDLGNEIWHDEGLEIAERKSETEEGKSETEDGEVGKQKNGGFGNEMRRMKCGV